MRLNYDEMAVICEGTPSKEAWRCYYRLLIDILIRDYGKEKVEKVFKEIIK